MNHFQAQLPRNLHASCASGGRACVLCAKLLQCCCPRTWPARDPGAVQRQANTFLTLHIAPFTLHTCTSAQLISSELFSSHFMSSHMSATFFLAIFMSSERSSNFLISPELVSTHLGSSARQKAWDTRRNSRNSIRNCSSKTGARRHNGKKTILQHFLKELLKGKLLAPKNEKICWQITVAALMQPLQYYIRDPAATFMQPLQCILQHHVANPHIATPDDNNHAAIPLRSETTDSRHA